MMLYKKGLHKLVQTCMKIAVYWAETTFQDQVLPGLPDLHQSTEYPNESPK